MQFLAISGVVLGLAIFSHRTKKNENIKSQMHSGKRNLYEHFDKKTNTHIMINNAYRKNPNMSIKKDLLSNFLKASHSEFMLNDRLIK